NPSSRARRCSARSGPSGRADLDVLLGRDSWRPLAANRRCEDPAPRSRCSGDDHPTRRIGEGDRRRGGGPYHANCGRGREVPERLNAAKDSETAAAQMVWQEPGNEGRLSGLRQADAAAREQEGDHQQSPSVGRDREERVRGYVESGPAREDDSRSYTIDPVTTPK